MTTNFKIGIWAFVIFFTVMAVIIIGRVVYAGVGDYDSPYPESSSSIARSPSSAYSGSSSSGYLGSGYSGGVTTIQPPVGLPSHVYTSPSGITTIQPPVGLPTMVYPGQPTTVQPPVGLPGSIYGR